MSRLCVRQLGVAPTRCTSKRGAVLNRLVNLQELVEGKSLAQMVEAGWKPSKPEVERIAAELLSSLAYLQQEQVHPAHHP